MYMLVFAIINKYTHMCGYLYTLTGGTHTHTYFMFTFHKYIHIHIYEEMLDINAVVIMK